MDKELIKYLNETFSLTLKEDTHEALKNRLAIKVNDLINNDFTQLVSLLYKVDVNEAKLKRLLKENDTNAGDIIAELIIERQLQKIKSRRESRRDNNDFTEEEKW